MFQSLRWLFLLTYLLVMSAIFGTSSIAIYIFFSRSLEQQLNERLQLLTEAAIPSLRLVKNRGILSLDNELPWQDLFRHNQSLEWFTPNGNLLAKEGKYFSNLPRSQALAASLREGFPILQQQGQVRTFSIAVYAKGRDKTTLRLEGYIRASESTQELVWKLEQLRLGLGLGGVTVLVLSSVSGIGLTWLTLQPMQRNLRRLKQFTTDLAHELRNPLTAISTTVELLRSHQAGLSPAQVRKLAIIDRANDQIIHLVEDLLILSRANIDNDRLERDFHFVPVPLEELLQDLVDRFEPQAHIKQIQFTPHLRTGMVVKGDRHKLSRLFSNLLDNALKYTTKGGRVALFLEQEQRFAVIRIEDTGIGIAPDSLPLIFQRFWRADKVRIGQKDGLGLGLAIAQAIVQQHHGEIKVSSRVGVGSSFRVFLPLDAQR
jgi:signal transduction histidine kinase